MKRCTLVSARVLTVLSAAIPLVAARSAQADPPTEPPMVEAHTGRLGLTLSYFGETGTHPGMLAAVEYPLLRAGGKHQVLARAQLGGWIHPRMYAGLFTGGEVAYRATARFGLQGELAAGAAYLRTFVASDVYEVEPDGSVSRITDWGRSHFMPSASFGIGWDFGQRGGPPLAVMLRNQAFWEIPYNTRSLLHLTAIVGVTYTR